MTGWFSSTSTAHWSTRRPVSTTRVRVAAAALGLPDPTPAAVARHGRAAAARRFRTRAGLPAEDVDRAVAAYRAHYVAGAMLEAPPYAGIPELLDWLRADGATLAVTTSKPEPFAVRILGHVGLLDRFASVHGATLDGAVRHKEQVVAAALAVHPRGRTPVLIGDRAQDGGCHRPRAALHRGRLGPRGGRRTGAGRRR